MQSNGSSDKLIAAKTALFTALGDQTNKYLSNMKIWFRSKWTKEEFDFESRKLLTNEKMHLHNQFLISILNKIDTFNVPPQTISFTHQNNTSQGKSSYGQAAKRKRKRARMYTDRARFEPIDFLDYIVEDNLACIQPPAPVDGSSTRLLPTPRYSAQELFLPDVGLLMGRFLVGSWEVGLTSVDDVVAEYIAMAVQVLLKNLISNIIMKKKHFKSTGEGAFYYDIGVHLKDPTLRNTVTRQKIDDGPLELDKEITSPNFLRRPNEDGVFLSACEEIYPQTNNTITLRDLQLTLGDHNCIASHSVYAINMERITQMIH